MEFTRRIGELAQLTRRLNHVQAEKVRAQRHLASSRNAPRTAASASSVSQTLDNSSGDDEKVMESFSLAYRRQRRAAPTSYYAQARGAHVQDQLLMRRIPVAVSLVERSWCKLDRKQWERNERLHRLQNLATVSHTALGEELPKSAEADSTVNAIEAKSTPSPLLPSCNSKFGNYARSTSSGYASQSWSLRLISDDKDVAPLPRARTTTASRQQIEAVYLLLQLLHSLEQARRHHLQDKQKVAQHRCSVAESTWQNFQKEFALQLHPSRPRTKCQQNTSLLSEEDDALLRETARALQQRLRAGRDDVKLLHSSLLTRSFLSARLWKLLMREPVWTAVVSEHKRAAAVSTEQPTSILPSNQADVSRLLLFSLALTRIAMGILRDYVQGGQLSRQAPRFVVSLPSRTYRARGTGADKDDASASAIVARNDEGKKGMGSLNQREKNSSDSPAASSAPAAGNEDADLLFSMLQNGVETPASASPQQREATELSPVLRSKPRHFGKGALSMRWIPPHTAEVVPLVTETLALHSLVLPELEVPALLELGCAPELMSLCATLQQMASMTLALAEGDGEESVSNSSRAPLHRTLRALENALATVGAGVVSHLIAECQTPLHEARGGAAVAGRVHLSPADAARLAVQLHRLRLLPTGDASVKQLLRELLTDIFPELRTQTSRVLREKARQSSLLAFATRPHRQKLYQQHGRKKAEKYLLETVVQQARLQQRQLAAALREQHVNEAHVQALCELGQRLPPTDLIHLFQLYARYTDEGAKGQRALSTDADIWVTGCLFLTETILISNSVQHDASSVLRQYSLSELATLWDAAMALLPHIRTRRARQLAHQRDTAPGRPRAPPIAHTESIIWSTFVEQVLAGINAALAERLQAMEVQRQAESTAMRRSSVKKQPSASTKSGSAEDGVLADQTVSVDSVVALAAGMLEYAGQDGALRESSCGVLGGDRSYARTPSTLQPIQHSVRVLSRLLHELLLHDRTLWHQVRRLPAAQRDAVERQLRECFHTLGMLDGATTRALSALKWEESVPL
ncbi:hypothetical protein ABL78_0357 [Leptomonas seymouri]|uniref:Uncharacterized protein n=1 Tax=Leptomonas seymouri TaxID=5684 RepID=A0A0N0P9D8_LEPSE|nr:hypothetical protein ABL78_0357 [Leptomonas seymouri]|eukprot:KPI90597.1 hypothetical protein ABL78_0357 [Leptomonas seymouri]